MIFKVNTEKKEITINHFVNIGDLVKELKNLFKDNWKEWNIIMEPKETFYSPYYVPYYYYIYEQDITPKLTYEVYCSSDTTIQVGEEDGITFTLVD